MNLQKIIIIGILFFSTNLLVAQEFTNYTTSNSGLPDNYINGGVAIDQNNDKWFGTGAGVAKFDDDSWTVYTTADGLTDDYTTCISVDVNNNIWVGTDLGANKFDGTSWTSYTSADGFPQMELMIFVEIRLEMFGLQLMPASQNLMEQTLQIILLPMDYLQII